MFTLLNEEFYPLTAQYGFVKSPMASVVEACQQDLIRRKAWRKPQLQCEVRDVSGDLRSMVTEFDTSEKVLGKTNSVLLISCGEWVAWFENGLDSHRTWTRHGPRDLSVDTVTVGSCLAKSPQDEELEEWEKPETGREGFVLFRHDEVTDQGNGGSSRLVSAAYDLTEWTWDQSGPVRDYEEPERYLKSPLRDRLTSTLVDRYCRALGIRPFDEEFFERTGFIVRAPVVSEHENLMGETCFEYQSGIQDFIPDEAAEHTEV